MRSAEAGIIPGVSKSFSSEFSLAVFRRMCSCRYFEEGLIEAVESGKVNYQVYLSTGQEAVSSTLAELLQGYMIFAQHRCHDTYLAFGGPPEKLRDELLGLPTGTSGGRAGSNCLQYHSDKMSMFGHHGLIGENVPLAVGAALGSGKPVVCFFGDGAAEEDYVLTSMGFAATHNLPVFFVCHDNNLSILTETSARRAWNLADAAAGVGLHTASVTDDPWSIAALTRDLCANLPALLTVQVCRKNWHVGTGVDGPPEWDRFEIVKQQLESLGLEREYRLIEGSVEREMRQLWQS